MRNPFKHLVILLVFITGTVHLSLAQDFLPTLNDNYMGINQAFLQPASIADSRFSSDFNIGGFGNDIYNDAMRFRSRWLLYPTDILTNDDWWDENTYLNNPNGKDKSMFMSQSLLGPGFLASIDSGRFAIGFTSRVRSITNTDDVDEPLFRLMYSNYQDNAYYNHWYYDQNMRAVQHVFGDYGVTFAMAALNKGQHFLKAGGTLKLLQGIAASYLQTDELYYYFDGQEYPNAKPLSLNSPYVYGGISDNWGDLEPNGNYSFSMNYQLTAKPSVGLDLGVVYEFRKDMIKDGVNRLERVDKNKYFVKVGISLLDIGRLKYQKDYYSSDLITSFTPDYSERYLAGDQSVPTNTYWMDADLIDFNYKTYVNFSYEMNQRAISGQGVQKATDGKEKFTVRLPAAFSLQVDLNLFVEGLYVNLTTYNGLNQGFSKVPNSHYISNYSITPRYEHKWYSVSLPVQVNQYKKLEVGLGARAGVVYFGVNNLFSNVFSDPYGIHAYVGVKVPIHYKDPTKTPKEPKQKYVCCPCCSCVHPGMDCCKCNKMASRDTSCLEKMNCIPGGINTLITGSKIIARDIIIGSTVTNTGAGDVTEGADGTINTDGSGPGKSSETDQQAKPQEDSNSKSSSDQSDNAGPGNSAVYFDFNSYKINPSDLSMLNEYVAYLKADTSKRAKIAGYTDSIDTDEYNQRLSRNRAGAVYNYFIDKGVLPKQIEMEYHGESNPKGDNKTPEGRQKNRRVEIELIE